MKHSLLSCLILLFAVSITSAQTCEPDQMYADSAFGVYPAPYDTTTMTGGISESACINSPYFFALTLVVPTEVSVPGIPTPVPLTNIQITGVTGLPSGMAYTCTPADCVYEPADGMGCAAIYGTADDTNSPGDYPLSLEGLIVTPFGEFDLATILQFLGTGNYVLTLEAEGSSTCFVNTEEPLNDNIRIETAPNPFYNFTTIQIESGVKEELQFNVYNVLGERVHSEKLTIFDGTNTVVFDGSHLANGIYHFNFTDGQSMLSQKMLIQR